MVNTRTFQFSHALFWGFKREVDLDEVESLDDIYKTMCEYLVKYLKKENLQILVEKLDIAKLHIHDFTFEQILMSSPDVKFYICDHC